MAATLQMPMPSALRSIVRDVTARCDDKGERVPEQLASFVLQGLILDPDSGYGQGQELSPEDLAALSRACVERLLDRESIALDTSRLQTSFAYNYLSADAFDEQHAKEAGAASADVDRAILEARGKGRDQLDALHRQLVSSVLQRAGMGAATDMGVVRETTAATESVLPAAELGNFMALSRKEKREQLQDLCLVVSGIRLFNRHLGKGGHGIDDLPAKVRQAIVQMTSELSGHILALSERSTRLSAGPVQDPAAKGGRAAIINCEQAVAFLFVLQEDLYQTASRVQGLSAQLAAGLHKLESTVQSQSAVPTDEVYPLFMAVAEIWRVFQREGAFVRMLQSLLNECSRLTKNQGQVPDDLLGEPVEGAASMQEYRSALFTKVSANIDRLLSGEAAKTEPVPYPALGHIGREDAGECKLLLPDVTEGYDALDFDLGGFCPVRLATDGIPIPARPGLGALGVGGRTYGFSSAAAAAEFAKEPTGHLERIRARACKDTTLIQLLGLHTQFAGVAPVVGGAARVAEGAPAKCDGGTQTDTHILAPHIDKAYESNEWELRRKALKLANLRTKRTHSTQTSGSNFRRDNATQVYLPKANATQTKKDASTSVPKPTTYIRGIRGTRGAHSQPVEVVDLTLGINGIALAPRKAKAGRKV